jgi:spore germination protein KB
VFPYAEVFLALNILPNLNDKKKTFKSLYLAVLVAGGVMYLFTIRNISVLGVNMTAINVFPSEKVFRLMPALDIIPLLDINVIVFGILKVSVVLYAQAKMLGDIFGLKEFKIYVLPLATLDIILSTTLHPDFITELYVANNIVPLMYVPVLFVMPLIMLIISLVKKENPDEHPLKLE